MSETGDTEVKTEKQLKAEAKKKEKLEKFRQKQEKLQQIKPNEKKREERKSKKDRQTILYEKDTKPGERKDITEQAPDSYSPKYVEACWYSWWEKSGFFKPEINPTSKQHFTIIIPPPNITGDLHLGHALTIAIEDALVRWNRMSGLKTLWNPGYDHAGIATQVVVERKLWLEKKQTRHDLGREKFIAEVNKWKEQKANKIRTQLSSLGCSLDWDRNVYTMDEKVVNAVNETFIRLHDEGLIYRANRLVNWCCSLRSAISDIEVDKLEIASSTLLKVPGYDEKIEFGVLVKFAYLLEDGEKLAVATTRVETMLGDVALAVNPTDERYKHLVGKFTKHPLLENRKIPIIADEYVDKEFGTGVVKITPGHDHNDYAVGKRHNLESINMLTIDGLIADGFGKYSGMKRFDARKQMMIDLDANGCLLEKKDHEMVLPICSRSKDVIEPMLKPQWYANLKKVAEESVEAVKKGDLKIFPTMYEKTWFNWLDNIEDWCISRQLWWGIRIPAFEVKTDDNKTVWVSARTEEEARKKLAEKEIKFTEIKQDEDVLDTWFSSALFPFAIFGWPNKDGNKELEQFFPNSVIETGVDILFFWVARMVMMSLKLTGKLPFTEIRLHSIVRDSHGRKMSKSLGNVIDPLHVISGISLEALKLQLNEGNLSEDEKKRAAEGMEKDFPDGIPECGTDALRFALCSYTSQARSINLNVLRVQGYRFFCNKLWNLFKFIKLNSEQTAGKDDTADEEEKVLNTWLKRRLTEVIITVNESFANWDLAVVTSTLYDFILHDLCDFYVEAIKNGKKSKETCETLIGVFEAAIVLLAPFMPYICEELWQRLRKREDKESVSISKYPTADKKEIEDELKTVTENVEWIRTTAAKVRSYRSENSIIAKTAVYVLNFPEKRRIFTRILAALSGSSEVVLIDNDGKSPSNAVYLSTEIESEMKIWISNEKSKESKEEKENKVNSNATCASGDCNRSSSN